MNLVEELSAALRDQADAVEAPPALAGRALTRGRALRRRRRITATAVPATAVAFVVAATGFVTGGDRTADVVPPPAATPTASDAPGGEPPRPYARQPAEPGGAGSVHLEGRDIALPAGHTVLGLQRVRGGVVLDLDGPHGAKVWFAGRDGELSRLLGVDAPSRVNADGTLVAAPGPDIEPSLPLTVRRMPLTNVLEYTLDGEHLTPVGFVGTGDDILVGDVRGAGGTALGVWHPASIPAVIDPVRGYRMPAGAVPYLRPGGPLVVAEERLLRVVDLEKGELWTRTGRFREGPAVDISPDGRRIALAENGGLTVVSTADGAVLSQRADLGFDAAGVQWTSGDTVLVSARDARTGRYDQRVVCRAAERTPCEEYALPDAVLPG
jgi:hypothetical protein